MPSKDLRENNEKNWQDVRDFMARSDLYRDADKKIQDAIWAEAKRTNGRISELEDWRKDAEFRIKERREQLAIEIKKKIDRRNNIIIFINIVLAVIVAVSGIVMCFKK